MFSELEVAAGRLAHDAGPGRLGVGPTLDPRAVARLAVGVDVRHADEAIEWTALVESAVPHAAARRATP